MNIHRAIPTGITKYYDGYKLIADNVLEDKAFEFRGSSYVLLHLNSDNTYQVWAQSTKRHEIYPFGYKLKESDSTDGIWNAWVDRRGGIHYVFEWGHSPFAYGFHRCEVTDLEREGWVHYSLGSIANTDVRMTRSQKDAMYYLFSGIGKHARANEFLD